MLRNKIRGSEVDITRNLGMDFTVLEIIWQCLFASKYKLNVWVLKSSMRIFEIELYQGLGSL